MFSFLMYRLFLIYVLGFVVLTHCSIPFSLENSDPEIRIPTKLRTDSTKTITFVNDTLDASETPPKQRIYNGVRLPVARRRNIALLWVKRGNVWMKCTGTLITRRHILTAAHCLKDINGVISMERSFALVGEETTTDSAGPNKYSYTGAWIHSSYNVRDTKLRHDIAIIMLARSVSNAHGQPISMAHAPRPNYYVFPAGYGVHDTVFSNPSTTIRNTVPEYAQNKVKSCSSLPGGFFNSMQLCTTAVAQQKACKGDSGGPVFWSYDGNVYTVGIVSRGSASATSCSNSAFTVHARIGYYERWILARVNS